MTARLPHSIDPDFDSLGRRRRICTRGRRVIDLFAEALSEHGTTKLAASAAGISYGYGRRLLLQIRHELGDQAV